jgi:hypothetical protein
MCQNQCTVKNHLIFCGNILHNAHEYEPMETAVTLLPSAHRRIRLNTLENYCIHFFYQHNIIIKEQTQKGKNPIFELTSDIQSHLMSPVSYRQNSYQILDFSCEWFTVQSVPLLTNLVCTFINYCFTFLSISTLLISDNSLT